jgi:hypothetical protein
MRFASLLSSDGREPRKPFDPSLIAAHEKRSA